MKCGGCAESSNRFPIATIFKGDRSPAAGEAVEPAAKDKSNGEPPRQAENNPRANPSVPLLFDVRLALQDEAEDVLADAVDFHLLALRIVARIVKPRESTV